MKLIVSLLVVFLVIVTIGAPPVIENVKEETKKTDSGKDASDEVVRKSTDAKVPPLTTWTSSF